MNISDKWPHGSWVPYTIAVCSGVLFYYLLQHIGVIGVFLGSIWSVITPLVIGVILAYIMDPVIKFFEKKGLKRKPAVILGVACIVLVVVFLLLLLIPQLLQGMIQLIENFSYYTSALEGKLSHLGSSGDSGTTGSDITAVTNWMIGMLEQMTEKISGTALLTRSMNFGSGMGTFLMGFILAIYFLFGKDKLITWLERFLARMMKDYYKPFLRFCSRCDVILMSYISCSLIEALLVGCANALFMMIFRMPYVTVVSTIVGLTNLAPTFGPIVGCLAGMFILLLIKPIWAVYFLIFTLILQLVDGYIVKPKLFGNTLGVSPLLILIFIILGGRIFGVWGILLAIPFAAIAQYLAMEYFFPLYAREMHKSARRRKQGGLRSHVTGRSRKVHTYTMQEENREAEPDDFPEETAAAEELSPEDLSAGDFSSAGTSSEKSDLPEE